MSSKVFPKFFLIALLLSLVYPSYCQNKASEIFENFFMNSHRNKELFRGQVLKGKRNGMGILINRDHWIYVGDFLNGEINGSGLLISTDEIPFCPGSKVYVGKWKNGKKNGKGICYAENGDIIYSGLFESDKPTELYPSHDLTLECYYSVMTIESGGYYIGEFRNGTPNGYGIILFGEGESIQGKFSDGERKGIGLYITPSGEWETHNVKDGDVIIVSSSENYNNIDSNRKSQIEQYMNGIRAEFADILTDASQLLSTAASISAQNSSGFNNQNSSESLDNSKSASSSHNTNQHSLSEVESKNIDSRTYSSWESQLIKMNTYYESQYNNNNRMDIQSKMRAIRTKWEKRGFRMYHSSWEDWDGAKK